jgi:hypothetical protein
MKSDLSCVILLTEIFLLYASACTTTAQQIWQQHCNQSSGIHSISQVHLHRPYTHAHVHTHTHTCTYTQRDYNWSPKGTHRESDRSKKVLSYHHTCYRLHWKIGVMVDDQIPQHTCVLRRVFACCNFLSMDSMH